MLIPQSLAYALLAGLPPEAGLYASIAPIILYAIFGTSRALAVGPVAVVSLMTAAAIGNVAEQGTMGYAAAALTLAGAVGGDPAGDGRAAAGLSGELPVASGDRGLHHRVGHPDRDQPAEARPGHRRGWPHPAGDGRVAGPRHCAQVNPVTLVHRRGGDGLPVLGPQGAEAAAAPHGPGRRALADIADQGRAGAGRRGHARWRSGGWAWTRWACGSWARCRRACRR